MGKDSTETKIDDLLYHVTSIVDKQRKEVHVQAFGFRTKNNGEKQHLMKENWNFFLFDLQFTIITIKILILPQELEKKRNEERVRQKAWEQRHRLGSFRRRAKLPVPADEEGEPSVPTTQSEEQTTTTGPAPTPSPAQQPPSSIPPGQYLRPVYPTTGQLSGRATPGRRLSDVGLATSMLGRYRFMHDLLHS